jgi:hypothetical protein
LAGLQVKRAAPNHVRKRFKRAGRLEFQGGAQRIPGSEPEQRAVVAVSQFPPALPELGVKTAITFQIEAVHGRRLLFQCFQFLRATLFLVLAEVLRGRRRRFAFRALLRCLLLLFAHP